MVKDYESPVKTLKIGNVSYVSKFKKQSWYTMDTSKLSKKKVTIKAAKNWKLKTIRVNNARFSSSGGITDKSKTYKKSGITTPKKLSGNDATYSIVITLQNTKTKGIQTIYFQKPWTL